MLSNLKLNPDLPTLIAGPTASGKTALAIKLAQQTGARILNADALQVYRNWQILTARPDADELALAPHHLYGHVAADQSYSVGHWLREVAPYLKNKATPPIIVGGTGLYFAALTEGLAEIPDISDEIRLQANHMHREQGLQALVQELAQSDPETLARIDQQNPMRVLRAWEVLRATGRGMADWQDATPPPMLPIGQANAIVLDAPKELLTPRINQRFHTMLKAGALDECRANLADWEPNRPSDRAIGAAELIAYLQGETTLEAATESAKIATRQYAKRQRSWFRARMKSWQWLELST